MTDDKHKPPEPPFAPSNERTDGARPEAGGMQQRQIQPPVGPEGPRAPQPSGNDARELRSAQNFILVASIIGPVSLILASLFLSAIGIVCGFIGFRKLKALEEKHTDISAVATRMKRSAIIAMSVCGVAAAFNVVLLWVLFPTLLEFAGSGDYGNLLPGGGSSGSGTNSTWG